MPLPLQKTLSEARSKVLKRLGMGAQGSQTRPSHPLIDEFINQAQQDLYYEADWVDLRKFTEVPLVALQGEYDWPDDALPGQIMRLTVLNEDGREEQLTGDIRPVDRSRNRNLTTGSQPLLYDYHDGILEVLPVPNTDWVTLNVEYIATAPELVEDEDRLAFDSEAIIRMAVVFAKDHYGFDNTKDEARLLNYIRRIVSQQSTGEGFQLGGSQSHYVKRGQNRNRMTNRGRGRKTYFWNENPYS